MRWLSFFTKKKSDLSNFKIPNHVAIIMDGNARWAKSKNLPTSIGHKIGSENLRKIVKSCIKIGVKYLTVYAFSHENWNRPPEEVKYLMNLLNEYLDNETKPLMEDGVRILISGNLERLPDLTKEKIAKITELTKNNQKLVLNVAFSYGSRREIVDAVTRVAFDIANKQLDSKTLDEATFAKYLYAPEIPDPDLLIRTAGDHRLSNFLLWQSAYTELYFTDTYWPDFNEANLLEAVSDFNKRERRYGKR